MIEKAPICKNTRIEDQSATSVDRRIVIENGIPGSELVQGNFMRVRQCDDINQKSKKQAIFDNIKPESIFDLEFVQTWSKKKGFVRFSAINAEKSSEVEYAFLVAEFKNNKKRSEKSYTMIAMMGPIEEVETLNLPEFNFKDYYPQKE